MSLPDEDTDESKNAILSLYGSAATSSAGSDQDLRSETGRSERVKSSLSRAPSSFSTENSATGPNTPRPAKVRPEAGSSSSPTDNVNNSTSIPSTSSSPRPEPRNRQIRQIRERLRVLSTSARTSPNTSMVSVESPSTPSEIGSIANTSNTSLRFLDRAPSETIFGTEPSLSRQTAAETKLIRTLDEAKIQLDRKVSTMLLERMVTDTMAAYTVAGENQSMLRALDNLSLSMTDFISRYMSEQVSSRAPQSYRPSANSERTGDRGEH